MTSDRFHFGLFEFDIATRQLQREGVVIPLQAQPAQVLGCLLRRAGQVVSREDLRQEIWGSDTFVDFDRGLNFCISQIRSALRDDSTQPIYIRTVPKSGYQFIAPVAPRPNVSEKPASDPPARTSVTVRTFVVGISLALLAMVIVATYWLRGGHAAESLPIVAVLRFDNETGNPAMTQFSDGLTDNAVEQLTSQSSGRFSVIGNAQILRRPRSERDLNAIASSLHASYVVLGQVQANGDKIRILAHLIRLPQQTHISVQRIDRTVNDPLSVESEMAQKIGADFSALVASGATHPPHPFAQAPDSK